MLSLTDENNRLVYVLAIGIVGLPNVGKSTLFNALTKNNVLAANYPFATIEPNTGIVPVPDQRLSKLAQLSNSAKVVPATVKFVDIAGIVAGAHKGEGMGNAFLSHIRETGAIAQVVRAFEDNDIQHVGGQINPQQDIETINTELILADIQTIDNHLPKLHKQIKGDISLKPRYELLEKLRVSLNDSVLAINSGLDLEEISYLNLLTAKPFIYVFNVNETALGNNELKQKLTKLAPSEHTVFVSAKIEAELSELDDDESEELMAEYGINQSGLERLAKTAFETLNLQTFLTTGPKETKAWTIKNGYTAPQAAGTIHGDFERGFIAAEIIDYDELVQTGSWTAARSAGKLRTEGKSYKMRANDVVEFRFNV